MAYTEIVITKMKDHLVSMLLKDHQPVEFQCVSEKPKSKSEIFTQAS